MRFSCGCDTSSVDWTDVSAWKDIPHDCPAVWDLIGQGLVKGMFQLEGSQGKRWCRKIKPRSVAELSDVIALIRPGCLEAEYREDPKTGKMLTIADTYVKIRSGELEPEYIDPSLEPIMRTTYGVPVYQEQVMRICSEFAGLSLEVSDYFRKSIGKKIPEIVVKLEKQFVDGAISNGNDESTAKTIFGWLVKFAEYIFNLSHSVSYAEVGYRTAWAKVHYPTEFFKAMLMYSDSKIDEHEEIMELINEAKLFGIKVEPPNIKRLNINFDMLNDSTIAFGLAHIKNVGPSAIASLKPLSKLGSEEEIFAAVFTGKVKVKTNVFEALIKSGALDCITKDRVRMLGRYKMLMALTGREAEALVNSDLLSKSSSDWFTYLVENKIPKPFDKRIAKINEAWELIKKELGGNRFKMRLAFEKFHMGMTISGSETEMYSNPKVNCTCRDFLRHKNNTPVTLGVIIEDVRSLKDRNENWMCFMKVSDATYMLNEVVVFASVYEKVAWILEVGKPVLISGKKNNSSLLVNSIDHL